MKGVLSVNVKSSAISKIGYHDKTLYIEFKTGKGYEYRDVPLEVAMDFIESSSKGKYFNKYIAGVFDSEEIAA